MTGPRRKGGLTAVLDMLERELIEAPETEIAAVLHELGLRPGMIGSVALFELIGWDHLPTDAAAAEDQEPPAQPLPLPREFRRPN